MSIKMELAALLSSAIKNAPVACEFLPLNALLIDGARQNDKRPAWIRVSVPDSWVLNLMKNEKLLDGYVLTRVDREYVDSFVSEQNEKEISDVIVTGTGEDLDAAIGSGSAAEARPI